MKLLMALSVVSLVLGSCFCSEVIKCPPPGIQIGCITSCEPVCAGRDHHGETKYQTFRNGCYFKSFGCKNGYTYARPGACTENYKCDPE